MSSIPDDEVDGLHTRLDKEAEQGGYHLNPNREFTRELVRGLLVNDGRYGYWACPCRLADGDKARDLDIICPCDYRDPDIAQYGTCFCGLYVSQDVKDGKRKLTRIPERRPAERMMEPQPPRPAQASAAQPPAQPSPPAAGSTSAPGALPASSTPPQPSAPSPGLPNPTGLSYPIWRCRVCGYLCARGEPPETCPVCRAKKERFERFL